MCEVRIQGQARLALPAAIFTSIFELFLFQLILMKNAIVGQIVISQHIFVLEGHQTLAMTLSVFS
jgi:hypothetical protein